MSKEKDLGDVQRVTSGELGQAFQVEAPFETPEGKAVEFFDDHLGAKRGVSTGCGPFALGWLSAPQKIWPKV